MSINLYWFSPKVCQCMLHIWFWYIIGQFNRVSLLLCWNCSDLNYNKVGLNLVIVPIFTIENCCEFNMADASPRTDISTDDTDDKNQRVNLFRPSYWNFTSRNFPFTDCQCNLRVQVSPIIDVLYLYVQYDRGKATAMAVSDSSDRSKDNTDQKVVYVKKFSLKVFNLCTSIQIFMILWFQCADSPKACSKPWSSSEKPPQEEGNL